MDKHPTHVESLLEATRPLRDRVASHDVYRSLDTLEHVRLFMEHHVFAVWDFMALVKSLQHILTCTSVPWAPQGDPVSRRLINEITLDEESDESGEGGYISHFELYCEAMAQCGANPSCINDFVARIRTGEDVLAALQHCNAPQPSQTFVTTTWQILSSRLPHQIAAAFAIGREEIVPAMFQVVIQNIQARFPKHMTRFGYYLERHIKVDRDRHAPMAKRMLTKLCGEDTDRWQEATEAARIALQARIRFWDEIQEQMSRPISPLKKAWKPTPSTVL